MTLKKIREKLAEDFVGAQAGTMALDPVVQHGMRLALRLIDKALKAEASERIKATMLGRDTRR